MSIDVENEQVVHINQAAKEFPGRKPSLHTIQRWRLRGVRGVKLETCIIGGGRYTSKEAIQRFILAQNAAEAPEPAI